MTCRCFLVIALLSHVLLAGCQNDQQGSFEDGCALANAHAASHLERWNQTPTYFHQQLPSWIENGQLAFALNKYPLEKRTGQTITRSFNGETWEEAETIDYMIDTVAFELKTFGFGKSLDLSSCDELMLPVLDEESRDKKVQQLLHATVVDTALLAVWPPAISEDGNRALLYAETYCGGHCADGTIWLYEKHSSGWKLIASQNVWVS